MESGIYLILFQLTLCAQCHGLDIFHRGSKVTFYPESVADYFGYSVLLTSSGLTVGAPKAALDSQGSKINPGSVFTCSLKNLDVANTTCQTFKANKDSASITSIFKDYMKDDMWFGASIASVHGDILICAPRWTSPFRDAHMLANGICFMQAKRRAHVIRPLGEMNRQAFITEGTRKEYGDYGTHLNFYAYGQAGMSVKVTNNNSLIIGAPGLLQWTGGIIDYKFGPGPTWTFFSKQAITNPYYTKELGPDDYFGYAVEAGVFEPLGRILYVAAAPRSKQGYGQVLIFEPSTREVEALKVLASVQGPQLGSYFGAALVCSDVNGDGRLDLLVGAPNYVARGGDLPFDQGAVFVYLNREAKDTTGVASFLLEEAGQVMGSDKNGARFGTALADLGDVDGDGFRDIAIGAPWESNGAGAVYIYRGSRMGLHGSYSQRITAEGRGFGISISAGMDLDGNACNEFAAGAYASGLAFVYRCIPTLTVIASIQVPDAMDLPQNATNFKALFCAKVSMNERWPHVKMYLNATISIDTEHQRAMLSGEDEYTITAEPGQERCEEQVVEVKSTADLSKPITLKFVLKELETMKDDEPTFDRNIARLSEDSIMDSSFEIQLTRDCGEDLICRPLLNMSLDVLDSSPFVPGSKSRLGIQVKVTNLGEPAYGAKVYITLPFLPKRVPTPCVLKDLNLTCTVPAPLPRGAQVDWDLELEYSQNTNEETESKIMARLEDPFQISIEQELVMKVKPTAVFNISGQALPNATINVSRQKLYEQGVITLTHYYEINNDGPSDWPGLEAEYHLSEMLSLVHPIQGCVDNATKLVCLYTAPANTTLPTVLTLRLDLSKHGSQLEKTMVLNLTSSLTLLRLNKSIEVRSKLVLDPTPPVWPLIVGLTIGFLLLAAIVYGLYKYGFFSRRDREKLKQLQKSPSSSEGPCEGPREDPCGSTATMPLGETDESSQELLLEDSD